MWLPLYSNKYNMHPRVGMNMNLSIFFPSFLSSILFSAQLILLFFPGNKERVGFFQKCSNFRLKSCLHLEPVLETLLYHCYAIETLSICILWYQSHITFSVMCWLGRFKGVVCKKCWCWCMAWLVGRRLAWLNNVQIVMDWFLFCKEYGISTLSRYVGNFAMIQGDAIWNIF